LSFSRSFSVQCAAFSLLAGSRGTGCDEDSFPVHGGWDSSSLAGVCDCVKECMSFVM